MGSNGRVGKQAADLLQEAERSLQKAISRRGSTQANIQATRKHIEKLKSSGSKKG